MATGVLGRYHQKSARQPTVPTRQQGNTCEL
uniref:Uncharacterized protein n=1 Tax=Anguilla anguilla TaxID=7936 RepID=A0A0E9TRQ9_ANGAN